MKKLALLVGSLLVVSAAVSAKEVVPAPKAVAPEAPVQVVTKEVVVYRDKLVEAPKTWAPTGDFNASYEVGLYGYDSHEKVHPTFFEIEKAGVFHVDSSVTFAPKHTVYAEAETALELFPHKTAPSTWSSVGSEDALGYVTAGYIYDVNDMVSLDTSLTLENDGTSASKTVEFAPTVDLTKYVPENKFAKATKLDLVPTYSYTFKELGENKFGSHFVSLGLDAEFEGPHGITLGADLSKFFTMQFAKENKDAEYEKFMNGDVTFSLSKDFDLYKNGKHSVVLKGKAFTQINWAWNEAGAVVEHPDHPGVNFNPELNKFLGYRFGAKAELEYGFKVNDFSNVYAVLGTEVTRNKQSYDNSDMFNLVDTSAKVGLEVKF